jgi:hypothetical protein
MKRAVSVKVSVMTHVTLDFGRHWRLLVKV